MLSGAGTPLYDILSGGSSQKGVSGNGAVYAAEETLRKNISNGQDEATGPGDIVELSEDAQESLRKGLAALSEALSNENAATGDADANDILREQLAQAREQIEFITNLLKQGATPEQAAVLSKHLGGVGQSLEKIGRQLGLAPEASAVAGGSAEVEAVSLSLSFNQVTQVAYDDGTVAELRQSLDANLSFVQITATDNAAVQQAGPGGQISTATSTATGTSVAQEYRVTARSFRQLVDEFQKSFTDRDRVPLNLYNTIRNMVEAALQDNGAKNHKLDQTA
jgi:hypothetical protein